MKNVILASTSSLFGEAYLEYLKSEVEILFQGISELIFVLYARPRGISHGEGMFSSRVFLPELPPYEIQPGTVCAF